MSEKQQRRAHPPETPPRERRGSFAGLFSPGGLFSPTQPVSAADGDGSDHAPLECIPGVEAICVQLQRMDTEYRALLADVEEHAVSEIKAARQLGRLAEALAAVAVADGEGEGDWGPWSAMGSAVLEQSTQKVALHKMRAVAPSAEARQSHLWEEGGALYTPAVALTTVVKDLVDGVLARALAARSTYRATLADASAQVAFTQLSRRFLQLSTRLAAAFMRPQSRCNADNLRSSLLCRLPRAGRNTMFRVCFLSTGSTTATSARTGGTSFVGCRPREAASSY